jgi:hypothetical protein
MLWDGDLWSFLLDLVSKVKNGLTIDTIALTSRSCHSKKLYDDEESGSVATCIRSNDLSKGNVWPSLLHPNLRD